MLSVYIFNPESSNIIPGWKFVISKPYDKHWRFWISVLLSKEMFACFFRPLFHPALRDDHCSTHVLSSHSKHYVNIAALLCLLDADPYNRLISTASCQFSLSLSETIWYTHFIRYDLYANVSLYGVEIAPGLFVSKVLLDSIESD